MAKSDRWVQVPKAIVLRNLVTRQPTGEVYPFFHWLQAIVLMDIRFSVDWKSNRTAVNISNAFFEKEEGNWVRLSDNDYDLLKTATEEPQRYDKDMKQPVKGYVEPALFQQVAPYIEAIQNAKTEEPETT